MPTTLSPTYGSDAMKQPNYIAEFKDKNEYEQRINTAWRRSETECVEELLLHSEISSELSNKIQALAFDLVNVKIQAVKRASYKDYYRNFPYLLRKALP